ncbi:copper resistance protein CopC [Actinoplanes sp. TBRC 11911]|nr:copper resistance protein CopC [Actinoplanes sp. TBRC 11911]
MRKFRRARTRTRTGKRLLVGLAVVIAVLLPSAPAWAHNLMIGSDPAAGARLTTAPKTVTLRFLQTLNTEHTQITVSDVSRRLVSTTGPAFVRNTGTVTFSPGLANGTYTVNYRTLSIDGHVVEGSFPFTVADPTKPAAQVPQPAAASVGGGGTSAPLVIGVVVLAVLLVGAGAVVYLRSRRNFSPPAADH